MRSAILLAGEKFTPTKKFSPITTDDELKADFSALILPFPDKALARSADCSLDTVKCWKAQRSFPQGRYLMRLVQDFPKIAAWHDWRCGRVGPQQSDQELFEKLETVMSSDTPLGRALVARYDQLRAEQRNG